MCVHIQWQAPTRSQCVAGTKGLFRLFMPSSKCNISKWKCTKRCWYDFCVKYKTQSNWSLFRGVAATAMQGIIYVVAYAVWLARYGVAFGNRIHKFTLRLFISLYTQQFFARVQYSQRKFRFRMKDRRNRQWSIKIRVLYLQSKIHFMSIIQNLQAKILF